MDKVLILGGDGFVGKSFCEMQRRLPGISAVSRFPSLRDERETVVEDPWSLRSAFFRGFDAVFNCLGIAHRKDRANRSLFYRVNRDLAIHLATEAKAGGVGTFVQMSSVAVYGNSRYIDSDSLPAPSTHYGRSKLQADLGLLGLQDGSFKVLLLRPPMLYGDGTPGNMLRLISLVDALPVLPFADAEETRDFLCVKNFVRQAEYAISEGLSGLMLMADLKPFRVRELVRMISEERGKPKRIIGLPFAGLLRAVVPGYYRKLFGGLEIKANVDFPADVIAAFADPEKEIRELARRAGRQDGERPPGGEK
jgi:UDP-glucose 4-epimerase